MTLRDGPELLEVHPILVDEGHLLAAQNEEVGGIRPDRVAHRVEDRAVGSRDGRRQLLGTECEALIDHTQRRPHVVGERILEHVLRHGANPTDRAAEPLVDVFFDGLHRVVLPRIVFVADLLADLRVLHRLGRDHHAT